MDSKQELTEEIRSLDERIDKIGDLEDRAVKSFFTASNLDIAKASLYEFAFFNFASIQLHAKRMRYESEAEASKDRVNEGLKTLDQIKSQGNWSNAKKLFVGWLLSGDLTFYDADKFGLDRNTSVAGMRIFSETSPLGNEEGDPFDVWKEFLMEKISIIPDLTEPYEHTDIDRLKAEISS